MDPLAHITGAAAREVSASHAGARQRKLWRRGHLRWWRPLGTDSLTGSPAQVLGKVREFREAGVSAFMYTGSYHLPVKTLTGTGGVGHHADPRGAGGGEVAISDHRSSAPTLTTSWRGW